MLPGPTGSSLVSAHRGLVSRFCFVYRMLHGPQLDEFRVVAVEDGPWCRGERSRKTADTLYPPSASRREGNHPSYECIGRVCADAGEVRAHDRMGNHRIAAVSVSFREFAAQRQNGALHDW